MKPALHQAWFRLSFLGFAVIGSVTPILAQQEEIPLYVGKAICLECHREGDARRSCLVEPIAGHENSYQALSQPEASDIAWMSGVPEPPTESRVCLGCHAASADVGPRWTTGTFKIADGVQCEACHGAGSRHVDAARTLEKTSADEFAPPRTLIERESQLTCITCHRDRESHRMVRKLAYWKEPADGKYKTPVNLAASPDGARLYVACEQGDSLIVVDTATRKVIKEIKVGRQPHDVAVSRDGTRLFVTNRMSDSLSVIDAATLNVTGEIKVGDEPHGVRFNAAGDLLYVLNTGEDTISVIATESLREARRLPAGRGPWSLALSPDGSTIAIVSVVPRARRFQEEHSSELTVLDAVNGRVLNRINVSGANMMHSVAFLPDRNVALFTLMRCKNLVPLTRLAQGWAITNGLGILWPDGRVDQILLDEPDDYFPDANGVAISPDGDHALVTSGGSNRVAVVDVRLLLETVTQAGDAPTDGSNPSRAREEAVRFQRREPLPSRSLLGRVQGRGSVNHAGSHTRSDWQRREILPNLLGSSRRFVVKYLDVGANPRGVVFAPDGKFAYVANALDDSVTVIDAADFHVAGEIDLGGPKATTVVRRGERLFHSADNAFARQFSCRSCHPDGHVNGLTFDIEADGIGLSPVDNRSLRGIVDTNPFKWEGTNPSLSRQCGPRLAVFFTRLEPYDPAELDAVTRYMCTIPRPPNRYREPEGLTASQRRGKMVFERCSTNDGRPIAPENRCHTCHAGAYANALQPRNVGTTMWLDLRAGVTIEDFHRADEFGDMGIYYFMQAGRSIREFDVPHLNNIYEGAPYLHNGAAATLEEVWTRFNQYDTDGVTSDMTRQQFIDLIAYLKAL